VQRFAALVVLQNVGARFVEGEVVPAELNRAIECDMACRWLAMEMGRWPAPTGWPTHWWRVVSGEANESVTVAVGEAGDERPTVAAEKVRRAIRKGGKG
jgi:hypothetical protein